jgi:hypothetical protein
MALLLTAMLIPAAAAEAQASSALDQYQFSLATGLGLSDFTGTLGSHTSAGLGWTVRGGYHWLPYLGIEIAYFGARNGISDVRLTDSHSITTTSFTGTLKLSTIFSTGGGPPVEPYIFAGLGFAVFSVSGPPTAGFVGNARLYDSNSNLLIPMGLGADAIFAKAITLGARFTYNINVANRVSAEGRGDQYSILATIGLRY